MFATSLLSFMTAGQVTGVVFGKAAGHVSSFNNTQNYSIALYVGINGYTHRVLIGSRKEQFTLIVSLRSPMLWIPSITCTTPACQSKNRFDPSQSSTFADDLRPWSQKTFGLVSGVHGKDTVRIGSVDERQMPVNCTFGLVTDLSNESSLIVADGVFGLGVTRESGIPSEPFLLQLFQEKIVNPAMFTIYLYHQLTSSKAGLVTYGSTDSTNCVPFIHYHKVSSGTSIQLQTISMGTFTTNQTTMMPELVPTIVGPKADVEKIASSVGAKYMFDHYDIRCDATLPDFEFFIEKTKYTIASDKLIMKTAAGCVLALNHNINSSYDSPQWYFGAPLFMEYCITFDYTGKQLGFARAKYGNNTTTFKPVTTAPFTPSTKKNAPILRFKAFLVSILILFY
ncbi:unnamed protein product [Cylicocyclus nassatus]|uniref:Peptidase A1 domain-containing protein n=1 Tax=Cylicocyclus nassatus TaxID=53992 RepID=A0AA36H1M2_CYLNA|nr:unnamed protein product [Cylicocyclus nassatus]